MSTPPTLPPPSAQAVLLASHLRRLRLPAMLAAYPKLSQEAAQAGLSYEQFLLALVEQEVTQRDEHMQRRRLTAARFPALKTLDQYDFSLMPSLNKQLVLELAQGHYLMAKENVLCVGEIGTGKTHTATALGIAACRQGYRVRFLTAAGLVTELVEAHAAHRLSRLEQALLRLHLLILDEVGFVPFSKLGADLLFSVLAALHERVSLILTTTVPFADWAGLFGGDQRLAGALLDRLTFHAHLLHFSGESFRLRHSLQQQEADRRRR
jgi:DNA replication protein DnaC